MKIVVTGGTGFIGTEIVNRLIASNHKVVILTRNPERAEKYPQSSVSLGQWDAKTLGAWSSHVDGADAVINLAGELIAGKRWTRKQKTLILESRVLATGAIVRAIGEANHKPAVLVSVSAVGYYGNVESGDVTESSPKGNDFLSNVCEQWEKEASRATQYGVRLVIPRLGVVLEKDGGALQKLLIPFRLGVGGHLGSGDQWFPWIHRDDVVNIIEFALRDSSLSGVINAAAPDAVTMKQFCGVLGEVMRRPSRMPVPGFILRAVLGEMASMLLTGQRVIPQKLLETGYVFLYPRLKAALSEILS